MKIPLEEVESEWFSEAWPHHVKNISEHYGIYKDLFNGAYYVPDTQLHAAFEYDSETVTPVYLGNTISPSEVRKILHLTLQRIIYICVCVYMCVCVFDLTQIHGH